MIIKKTVNGKDLVTACTLATCCLTLEKIDSDIVKLSNENNQALICSLDELKEIYVYMVANGLIQVG